MAPGRWHPGPEATTIRGILFIATCLILGAALGAQQTAAPAGNAGPSASRPADLEDSGARLLDTSPRVIQPRTRRDIAAPAPPPAAGQIVDCRARILKIPGANWFLIRYEPEPNRPRAPQFLLPCQLLEQIESFSEGSPPPVLLVSGETTWYHKRSFLLLRQAFADEGDATPVAPPSPRPGRVTSVTPASAPPVTVTPPSVPPVPTGVKPPPVSVSDLGSEKAPDANAASRPAPSGDSNARASSMPATAASGPGEVDPEEIIRRLAGQRPGKSLGVRRMPDSQPVAPSVAPVSTQPAVASARGTMLVDRVMQISPDEKSGWWAGHFLGDNTLREPPVRLLPCSLLEDAENQVAASPRHLQFRVSGEMTEYKGRRYLLLRKLVPERDLGQF